MLNFKMQTNMPTVRGLKYRIAQGLHAAGNRIFSPDSSSILNIGADTIGFEGKRAAVIYTIRAIAHHVAGDVNKYARINEHTMYWESAEMVKQLNQAGYIVDYYDSFSSFSIDWEKYDLVIDEQDSVPLQSNEYEFIKIYYSTGNHWLFHNKAELDRIWAFHERHGIYESPKRQIPALFTDQTSDFITYFGADFQTQYFDSRPEKQLLNISAVYEPDFVRKNYNEARNKFIWLGSQGLLLKGLDLAVESFMKMPDKQLYICGNAEVETVFWHWLKPIINNHSNIHYMGWTDVGSKQFAKLAHSCVGTVYASSTEGGAGSVAQLTHFGLIPIVTESAAVRSAEALGLVIRTQEPSEIINQLVQFVSEVADLPDSELHSRCQAVYEFGRQFHTRKAYSQSFASLLEKVVS